MIFFIGNDPFPEIRMKVARYQAIFLPGNPVLTQPEIVRHYPAWMPIENKNSDGDAGRDYPKKKILKERTALSVFRLPEDYPREA